MGALDARQIEKAGGIADQGAAREYQLRHRLPAALRDRPRPVADAPASGEGVAHQRVGLEALEFLERREERILIVEMHHEADRYQPVVVMIKKRAAAGA